MSKAPIETDFIETLVKLLQATDLTEIEIEKDDLKIRVARELPAQHVVHAAPVSMPQAFPQQIVQSAPQSVASAANDSVHDSLGAAGTSVTSPMVGTVYLASAPDKPPFVAIGDSVKEGQTILIVEAMKTFNEIPATKSGKVTAILVQDGQPVEFGETLLVIE